MKKLIITTLIGFMALLVLSCETDLATATDIEITIDDYIVADNGRFNFGDVQLFSTRNIIGTISNNGTADLILDGNISLSGTDASLFSITAQPSTSIPAGESSGFTISLTTSDTTVGPKAATLSISNNDSNESDLTIKLTATAEERVWASETADVDWTGRTNFGSLVYDNKIWVFGGRTIQWNTLSDIWYSSDGKIWTEAEEVADWYVTDSYELLYFECEVFNEKMWILGGAFMDDLHIHAPDSNDVWCSSDGVTWTEASSSALWSGRIKFGTLVYDNKIWVLGGLNISGELNDVWYSSDGATWTEATPNAAWTAREDFETLVFDDKIWVLGGSDGTTILNDIWCSEDGVTWTEVTSAAAWAVRRDFASTVYDDKIWIFGGYEDIYRNYCINDAWYSSDGVTWTDATESTNCNWEGRASMESLVFNDRVWMLGGEVDFTGTHPVASLEYATDVWYW